MILCGRLYCWRRLLLSGTLVTLLAIATIFVNLPLRDSDKTDVARDLVAWLVAGRSVPGFGEAYADAQSMPRQKRFFVICDFIPPEVSLSDDPRVLRITAQQNVEVFKKHWYDQTAYVHIELKSASATELVLEFSNVFAPMAAHGYTLEFRRNLWGLRAKGKLQWVS